MTDVLLGLLVLGPAIITFLLRSHAALGFLVLCAGFVLSTSVIGGLKMLLSQADLTVADSTLALVLLIAPLVITLLLVRGPKKNSFKFWLQIATAICAGGLLALSAGPVISTSTSFDLSNSPVWEILTNVQSLIIGIGAVLSLALIWSAAISHKPSKKH